MFNVANRKEVKGGWHLAVQNEEDNRLQHQDERDDHFATGRALHREGFFSENNDDAQRNHAQRHTCNTLVVQQPGCNRDENHHANDCRQQLAYLQRGEVRLRAVLFNPALAESEVDDGDHQADKAQGESDAPAELRRQPRRGQHREEGTDVDGHVVHGKCTVQTRVVLFIAG